MPPSSIRLPAVAGRFYPLNPERLRADLNSYLSPQVTPATALGCIVPHAGYMYSGQVAGAVFSRLHIPDRVLILCPNHTGVGTPLSILTQGEWETPLGRAQVDLHLAEALRARDPLLTEDETAHRSEHAIEVELPFLQVLNPAFSFVPIALGTRQFEVLQHLGHVIAETISSASLSVLIVASSDMNHYENDSITRLKDRKAIDRILALDPGGLFETVVREDISMCGLGPAVAMMTAVKDLGARRAELVNYATSADTSGDRETVVGYAGVIVP